MKYSSSKIGKIIKEERKKLNYSQEKLGEKIKCSGKQISIYEKGNTIPPLDSILKLCEVFNCEHGYLLGEESYKSGTRNETFISDETGLTLESINSIKKITLHSKERIRLFPCNDSPGILLNKLINDKEFPEIIKYMSFINDLYERRNRSRSVFSNIVAENDKVFDEAYNFNNEDIENETNAKELLLIKQQIDKAELEKVHDETEYERESKYYRYLIQESITRILDKIFPDD